MPDDRDDIATQMARDAEKQAELDRRGPLIDFGKLQFGGQSSLFGLRFGWPEFLGVLAFLLGLAVGTDQRWITAIRYAVVVWLPLRLSIMAARFIIRWLDRRGVRMPEIKRPLVRFQAGSLLNQWVPFWALLGFFVGLLISQSVLGTILGTLSFAGIAIAVPLVLRAFWSAARTGTRAGASGVGAIGASFGAIPKWVALGALAGAAFGATIALWLDDGGTSELIGAALRLAPIGAVAGLLARLVVLALRRKTAA
ncbi:hypothetical protein [Plastoroseomonas arctica]|uniref:Uncharacterized protein n=1 Tax=Plastoroseomonas arctica TaxID=1509237 RepID=A0AAF1K6C0_9PROT|nr:hypothetical protein [Plastoroseomonas arctica]MBR0657174.1 hypothetical protein [Plastoroseomonas arctica]